MFAKRFALYSVKVVWGLALLSASAGRGHATVILEVANPADYGVYVILGSSPVFTPATQNPARADIEGMQAVMRQNGSEIIFSLESEGTAPNGFTLSTGIGPDDPYVDSVPIEILGTAGEPVGTPVTLTLTPSPGLSGNVLINNILNDSDYGIENPSVIPGLKVGDTFRYWLSMSGMNSAGGSLVVRLDVQQLGTSPVPEPPAGALLGLATLAAGSCWSSSSAKARKAARKPLNQ